VAAATLTNAPTAPASSKASVAAAPAGAANRRDGTRAVEECARPGDRRCGYRFGQRQVHFTLQLSSFQDRGEAEAFAAKFGSEKTYLVVSDLPGKGTWYRVRVGDFATAKEAYAGKLAFEKKHGVDCVRGAAIAIVGQERYSHRRGSRGSRSRQNAAIDPNSRPRTQLSMLHLLLVLSFASGMCGIAYEILYARLLTTYLGDMFFVSAAILAYFSAGIAVGSLLARRFVRWACGRSSFSSACTPRCWPRCSPCLARRRCAASTRTPQASRPWSSWRYLHS